jgi:putative membrane protein
MTQPSQTRRPRAFAPDDPAFVLAPEPHVVPTTAHGSPDDDQSSARAGRPSPGGLTRGARWGALLVSALLALASLAATITFARFVSVALVRDDWVGWTALTLLALAALAAVMLIGRELMGLMRLARLGRLRRDMSAALASGDRQAERAVLTRLKSLYASRPELTWGIARFADHERDVHDAGALAALADREMMAPLDAEARRLVLSSAKRVSTVTALSPIALLTVGFVLVENIGLLRKLAAVYGGRPGLLGSFKLARLVVGHLIGTGGVALTDDLLGQFLGQDVLRRVSRRLGEGAFNGALTARMGAAAIEVIRPLPFIEASPVRARDILKDLFVAQRATEPVASRS